MQPVSAAKVRRKNSVVQFASIAFYRLTVIRPFVGRNPKFRNPEARSKNRGFLRLFRIWSSVRCCIRPNRHLLPLILVLYLCARNIDIFTCPFLKGRDIFFENIVTKVIFSIIGSSV